MIEYLIDKIEDFKHIEIKQSGFLNKACFETSQTSYLVLTFSTLTDPTLMPTFFHSLQESRKLYFFKIQFNQNVKTIG